MKRMLPYFAWLRLAPVAAIVAFAAFLTGCASQGYLTDMSPVAAKEAAKSVKGPFYIDRLVILNKEGTFHQANLNACFQPSHAGPFTQASDLSLQEELRAELMACCRQRHPSLFAAEGEEAIPIAVEMKIESGELYWAGLLPGIMTLFVLPMKKHFNYDYELRVLPERRDPQEALPRPPPKNFKGDHIRYTSIYTPLGLNYWGDESGLTIKPASYAGDFTEMENRKVRESLESCADAIAVSLSENKESLSKLPLAHILQTGGALAPSPLKAPPPAGGATAAPSLETPKPGGGLDSLQ